jgi:hypothetical protein
MLCVVNYTCNGVHILLMGDGKSRSNYESAYSEKNNQANSYF